MGLVNSKDNSTNFIIIKIDVNRQLKESLLLKGSPELEKFKKICEKYGIFEIGFGLDSKTIDIEILETLESYSRSGVPLYIYWKPGMMESKVLPAILTEQILLDNF